MMKEQLNVLLRAKQYAYNCIIHSERQRECSGTDPIEWVYIYTHICTLVFMRENVCHCTL